MREGIRIGGTLIRRRDVVWFLLGVVGLTVAIDTSVDVVEGDDLMAWDTPVADFAAEHATPAVIAFMAVVSTLGGVAVTTALVAATATALYFLGDRREALRLVVLVGLVQGVVVLLKLLFARPRPDLNLFLAPGYAFPSGHAATAAVLACILGWLAIHRVRHRLAASLLVSLAFLWVALTAASRIVVGAHYFTDVVGGAGVGLAVGGFGMAGARVLGPVWVTGRDAVRRARARTRARAR